jgi:adenosylhomocysteine nucleosidase
MVCKEMNVDFVSVKYITDIIGQNSGQIWLDKLRDAREALKEFFA